MNHFLYEEPIVFFAILLAVILIVPLIFERLRIPGIIGLLLAGVFLGQSGLKLLDSESQIMKLLSDVGLLYLMFVAGLEIDLQQFDRVKYRAAGFGSLTFIVPLVTGIIIGRFFGFGWNSAILLGSLLSSHTLMTYPIVSRLGVVRNEAVTVTIGGTIFTDIGALIVLAICIGINKGNFTAIDFFLLLSSLGIYTAVIIIGFDRLGKEFLRRSGTNEGNQFLFVLLAVFLAALGAQLIGVEKIVGAFLAGLAVNDAVERGAVKEKVIFVGSVLFIPIFFVDIGLIINIPAFISSLSSIWLCLAIVFGLIFSKFVAAFLTKLLYRYSWQETLTIWSMSLPQVAATLAAAIVGNRAGLLSDEVLNSVVVMMVVTVTIAPLITSRSAIDLPLPETNSSSDIDTQLFDRQPSLSDTLFKIVVPVSNPQTEQYLIEMAALLARDRVGQIVPLSIVTTQSYLNVSEVEEAIERGEKLLQTAVNLSQNLEVSAKSLLRIDDRIAQGITRASQEQKASLIIMGWGQKSQLQTRLFGSIIDRVFWEAHCPVAVTRLLASPQQIKRILVPIENFSVKVRRKIHFTQILANVSQATVTLLLVTQQKLSAAKQRQLRLKIFSFISKSTPNIEIETQIIANENPVKRILKESKQFDLLILHSLRHPTNIEGFTLNDATSHLVEQLTCSVIVLGEPPYTS
jgi:Kef-type K+ transport system membrane component KefB/nucleotide-binding universal stress UspA family protein